MSLADLTSSLKTFSIYGIASAHAKTLKKVTIDNQQNTIDKQQFSIENQQKTIDERNLNIRTSQPRRQKFA
jgi:hypothetical protein